MRISSKRRRKVAIRRNLLTERARYAATDIIRCGKRVRLFDELGGGEGGRPQLPRTKKNKRKALKKVLALPDLQQSKAAVLTTLTSASAQRTYNHAIDEFVDWYCSEPRLAFNRTVVLRYRIHLEENRFAPSTINLRLAAVRRIAYEAADSGLLSPELAAGIRRVKGVRRLGVRLGNWLTPEQCKNLLNAFDATTLRGTRDRAMVPMLLGCGLRRAELLSVTVKAIQQREDHWVVVDLIGKGGHVRTVPIPGWVKAVIDNWADAAGITEGRVFRAINRGGLAWGEGMTSKVIWEVVKYLGCKQKFRHAVNDKMGIEPTE